MIPRMPETYTRPMAPRDNWTDAMRRTRDNPNSVFRVYEIAPMMDPIADLLAPAQALVQAYAATPRHPALPVDWTGLDMAHAAALDALNKYGATVSAWRRRLEQWSPGATYYVRVTAGGGVHAVGIVDHPSGATRVYYGRATGYGYDKTAAALSGMPLPGRHGWYLTDHSAMREGWTDAYGSKRHAVMVHRGGYLPQHLVIR